MIAGCGGVRSEPQQADPPRTADRGARLPLDAFYSLQSEDPDRFEQALRRIADHWRDEYTVMMLESARLTRSGHRVREVVQLLEEKTGVDAKGDWDVLFRWAWNQPALGTHPRYAEFKRNVYSTIDPRFGAYFDDHTDHALIRLDEIRWGGVLRDGIPPLDGPDMVAAARATYLADTDIVFGIEIDGDARAYPKRVLAWHEMFKDTVGGQPVAGVYCTLCGSMILYRTEHAGVRHELGTSGFLYRSNKLMYDHATESLWSTLDGRPVVGPLVGKGIALEPLSVVTTTWGQWRAQHPETAVLSLETGHRRDYGEGVAYRDYFATDRLMFSVPTLDRRLKNKDEVLALRFGGKTARPTAIASGFLKKNRLYQSRLGEVSYVVLTDAAGAHRVYDRGDLEFTRIEKRSVIDGQGRQWTVSEAALSGPGGQTKARLPSHNAFWFGWYSANPTTALVH